VLEKSSWTSQVLAAQRNARDGESGKIEDKGVRVCTLYLVLCTLFEFGSSSSESTTKHKVPSSKL
jgi:hypothetical protein